MPNGTYGGVRGKETKVGQKTFVSRPTRFSAVERGLLALGRDALAGGGALLGVGWRVRSS